MGFLGGAKVITPEPPNNEAFMKWMATRDDRNNQLYAERQADIMKMEEERLELERASRLSLQQEEADLLAQAQAMETAAQEETTTMSQEADEDIDNLITGFYGSLGSRPS